MTSNIKTDLSSLDISKALPMQSYTLVMSEGWERFICNVKSSLQCHQELNEKEVYIVNTDAKHVPHLTKHEYENLGLRIVDAPLRYSTQKPQCGSIINEQRIFRPYSLSERYMRCNTDKIYRDCKEAFALSGEPFIFTNPIRKDQYHIRKEAFPKDSVLYISGPRTLTAAANYPAVMYVPEGHVNYVGSKNNGTTFIINNPMSGLLEGGVKKENTIVINFKANNIAADLYNGAVHYGSTGDIKLVNIYNYVSNSDSKQNITTHCKTRLVSAKNAEVWQDLSNCTDKDYEVRVVNKENVHHRGLKQTIFAINEGSNNARIVSDLGGTGRIKENMDVIDVQISDITKLRIDENTERNVYSLGLLSDTMHSVVSSVKVNDFRNLVIQAKRPGITESVIIQDKSLSDIVEDMRYKKLNDLGKDINREVIQNSKKKLKAVIQASILDLELPNTYQAAKNITDNNNLGIPVSEVEVIKNYVGVPTEKVIIAGTYSDRVIVDFSYSDSNSTHSHLRYRANGGNYDYDQYMAVCNYYQDIMVEGRKEQDRYVIKLPEYGQILQQKTLRSPIELDLNLKVKNKVTLYQNVPDDIIDLTALNVVDVDSISIKKGKRTYFNKCNSREVSDLTENSLEIKNVTVSDGKGIKWSLSIGLVDYFRGQEYQNIVLQMNNKFYKINNANLELEYEEVNTKPFRYYQPDEQVLQIYHNQPINENYIGLVDLKGKSIFDFDMEVVDDSLLLLHKNNTIAKVENWNIYQPARKMIFAFNDTMVSNSDCIAFTCNSWDIISDFNKAKEILLKEQLFSAIKQDNTNEVKDLIRRITDSTDTEDKHELISLHIAIQEGRLDIVILLFGRESVSIKDKDIDNYSPLHWAAQEGGLNIAQFLVDEGANIEDRNKNGKTPADLANQKGYTYIVKFLKQVQLDRGLLTAAESGDLNKVNDLVKQGASLEAKDDDYGNTPLHYASLNGNLRVVEYFIKNEANSRARNFGGETPVHYASFYGNLEVVKYFIENGAGLEDKDITGKTLLNSAALGGHFKVVEYLTEKGANLEAKDDNGYTPLHYASLNNDLDIAKYLIKNWASLEARGKNDKTPLNLAIQNGFIDVEKILKQAQLDRELLNAARNSNLDKVKDLIKDGAILEAKDWHGRTPLHHASLNGNLGMVEYLIRQNVTLDVQNLYGSTPVHDASWSGHLKVVEYLIENKADFEVEDKYGQTPLHYASRNGHLKVVECLIEKGASLVTDKYGRTPLDLASQKGYTNIVEFLKQVQLDRELFTAIQDGDHDKVKDLIKNGASLESKNKDGKTPTDLATQKGDIGIVKILKQAKLDRELFTAVQDGNLNKVKDLIKNGASLEARNKDGKTPLDLANPRDYINIQEISKLVQLDRELLTAVQDGNFNKVKSLVNQNADVNTNDEYGWTPLHFAASGSKFDIVKFLFDKNANIKAKDMYGNTPLHVAAQYSNNPGTVEFLLDKNAEGINDVTNDGWTPLHVAVKSNKLGTAKLLLDRGAIIGIKDKYNRTPLSLAAKEGYINIVQVIERTQLDLDEELLTVAESGDLNKIKSLITQGANLDAKDDKGSTPLHYASWNGHLSIVKHLVEKGANLKIKNLNNRTPLYDASLNGHLDVVRYLIEKGVDINAADEEDWTPLHSAVSEGHLDIVKYLINNGANFNAKNSDGKTPLEIAIDQGHDNIKEYLEKISEGKGKSVQRKRRHHHGDHSRHHNHLSRKPLAIDSSNQPEIAASSGTRPSSWINGLFGWVKGSVGGLFYSRAALSEEASNAASSIPQVDEQFAKASVSSSSSTSTTLPSDGTDKKQENGGFFRDNIDYVNANIKQMRERQTPVEFKPSGGNTILEMGDHYLSQVDFNGTIMLLDLLIRKVTGQKHISTVDQSISPLEAQGYALNITKGFERVVEQAGLKSDVSMHRLNIDYVRMQEEIAGKVMSGKFNEISGILNSYVEKACPGREAGCPGKLSPKKFDKFMIQFNSRLNIVLNQSIEQILHNRDSRLEVDDAKQMSLEPQSYLSNASVHSHSKVSTCLSDIGVTKLGNTLSK